MRLVNRIPPVKCLEAFEALAKVKSIKKAAHELSVTPSAISHRIKLLENILETTLFDRVDFQLTVHGEQYIEATESSLQILRNWSSCNSVPNTEPHKIEDPPVFAAMRLAMKSAKADSDRPRHLV